MSVSVTIPIRGTRETGQRVRILFPKHCVYCNGPMQTKVKVGLWSQAALRRRSPFYYSYLDLPYCLEHARQGSKARRQYETLMLAFALGISGLALLLWALARAPVLSVVIPLILAAGLLYALHLLLVSVNPTFREIPTLFGVGALGVTVRMRSIGEASASLELTFLNEIYADEFQHLNREEREQHAL